MCLSFRVPISAKGIVFESGAVWLRKNERNEWELPGGKLEEGEQPEQAVVREISEELGVRVKVVDIMHAHVYTISSSPDESRGVLVVSYLCELLEKTGCFETHSESGYTEFGQFSLKEIPQINMPSFYKDAINKAWEYAKGD